MARGTSTNDVILEESNDLENWTENTGGSIQLGTSPIYKHDQETGIASQYVRLRYDVGGAGANYSVLAAGINVANL